MNVHGFQQLLVVLNVPVALEELVVDWMLAHPDELGFTSLAAAGHGSQHEHLTPAELVSGRQRRVQIQVQLPAAAIDDFIDSARATFGTADVHFWVIPIIAGGHINSIHGTRNENGNRNVGAEHHVTEAPAT